MHRKIFKKQLIHNDLMKMREKWLNASIILIPNFLPVDSQWQICLWYRLEIYQSFYQN